MSVLFGGRGPWSEKGPLAESQQAAGMGQPSGHSGDGPTPPPAPRVGWDAPSGKP